MAGGDYAPRDQLDLALSWYGEDLRAIMIILKYNRSRDITVETKNKRDWERDRNRHGDREIMREMKHRRTISINSLWS